VVFVGSVGSFEKWQRKILLLCWCGYAGAYLCRVNISIALPGMMSSLELSKADAGLIGAAFFWSYAVGQLINGFIGDKVKSRPFIFIGLCSASIINLIIGFSSNFNIILMFWAFNGFFLSTLWGPIVRTLSFWFDKEKRTKVAVIISVSMVGGYLLAWGIVGQVIAILSWRWAFWIPAGIVFSFSVIWLIKVRSRPEDIGFDSLNHNANKTRVHDKLNENVSFISLVIKTRLWLIALACIAQGAVKESITLWVPTFLKDTQDPNTFNLSIISLAVPLMSFGGIMCAGWLNTRLHSNVNRAIKFLFSGAVLSSIILYACLGMSIFSDLLFLGATAALMYGANTLLLGIIPLNYDRYDKVSSAAGFLDFCSYVGAATASFITGIVIDNFGWRYVVICWILLGLSGMIFIFKANKDNGGSL
jgi:sugar phosphate permease